jgi:hypothetical protein
MVATRLDYLDKLGKTEIFNGKKAQWIHKDDPHCLVSMNGKQSFDNGPTKMIH